MNNVTTLFGKTIAAQMVQCCLFIVLIFLSACSTVSYDAGRLPGDLPPTVTSIYLQSIIPLSEDFVSLSEANNIHTSDPAPSADTAFIAKIVQSDVAIDLVHRGYKVTHDPLENHDICVTMLLFYQPDEWPIANRYIHLIAEVSKPDESAIFHAETARENWFGSIGDYVGFSGEKMMADTAHHIVDLILGQL